MQLQNPRTLPFRRQGGAKVERETLTQGVEMVVGGRGNSQAGPASRVSAFTTRWICEPRMQTANTPISVLGATCPIQATNATKNYKNVQNGGQMQNGAKIQNGGPFKNSKPLIPFSQLHFSNSKLSANLNNNITQYASPSALSQS